MDKSPESTVEEQLQFLTSLFGAELLLYGADKRLKSTNFGEVLIDYINHLKHQLKVLAERNLRLSSAAERTSYLRREIETELGVEGLTGEDQFNAALKKIQKLKDEAGKYKELCKSTTAP